MRKLFVAAMSLLLTVGLVAAPISGADHAQAASSCKLTSFNNAKGAKTLYAYAQAAKSSKQINSVRSTSLFPFASVTKVPTAVLARQVLGAKFRFVTKAVVEKTKTNSVTIVAGGDPTLSTSTKSVYTGAATIGSLASQVAKYAGGKGKASKVRNITINVRTFKSQYSSDYPSNYRTYGYVSRVSAWQVDGDRKNPARYTTYRVASSYKHATSALTKALASRLGTTAKYFKITYSRAKIATSATKVAEVKSPTLPTLLKQMLRPSDNTLANALAFQIALKSVKSATFANVNKAYKKELAKLGVPMTKGMVFKDGSGLSSSNRMTPRFVTKVLALIVNKPTVFAMVKAGLPVAGVSGTLASRFKSGYQKQAKGKIYAKTGYISSTTSLAGITKAKDGTTVVFASAVRHSKSTWRTRVNSIDRLATAYYKCGLLSAS